MRSISSINTVKGTQGGLRPLAVLFDFLLCGIMGVSLMPNLTLQRIYFVFYIFALACVSVGLRPKRDYTSLPLVLLSLWGMLGVFIHSYEISESSFTFNYLNMYLMSEGFIYLFSAVLFISLAVRHSSAWWPYCLLVPIGFCSAFAGRYSVNKTLVLSFITACLIYLLVNKRYILASLGALITGIFTKIYWQPLAYSFSWRIPVWKQLVGDITTRPFWGQGFNKFLKPDQMVWIEGTGWLDKHNDYLNAGACLGIPALLLILWFAISSAYRVRASVALIPFLMICVMSFFQLSLFRFERAGVLLLIGALCVRKGVTE